jgi:hypothetical protein
MMKVSGGLLGVVTLLIVRLSIVAVLLLSYLLPNIV